MCVASVADVAWVVAGQSTLLGGPVSLGDVLVSDSVPTTLGMFCSAAGSVDGLRLLGLWIEVRAVLVLRLWCC
jgi:hypothetical protein